MATTALASQNVTSTVSKPISEDQYWHIHLLLGLSCEFGQVNQRQWPYQDCFDLLRLNLIIRYKYHRPAADYICLYLTKINCQRALFFLPGVFLVV